MAPLKPRMMLKMSIDMLMTILLLCQMAYMLVGEAAHEWMGTAMFVFFMAHHLLNWKWYKNLARGRYTALRILQTFLNFLVLLSMVGLMVSGIIMSGHVFAFLPIHGGMAFARILHMISAYWGFILMSMHLGLHWGMVMGMLRKIGNIKKASRLRTLILRVLAFPVGIFGLYVFIRNDIVTYLFAKNLFVFFDTSQPLAYFFTEYLAMLELWVCAAYYAGRLITKLSAGK